MNAWTRCRGEHVSPNARAISRIPHGQALGAADGTRSPGGPLAGRYASRDPRDRSQRRGRATLLPRRWHCGPASRRSRAVRGNAIRRPTIGAGSGRRYRHSWHRPPDPSDRSPSVVWSGVIVSGRPRGALTARRRAADGSTRLNRVIRARRCSANRPAHRRAAGSRRLPRGHAGRGIPRRGRHPGDADRGGRRPNRPGRGGQCPPLGCRRPGRPPRPRCRVRRRGLGTPGLGHRRPRLRRSRARGHLVGQCPRRHRVLDRGVRDHRRRPRWRRRGCECVPPRQPPPNPTASTC